MYQLSKISIDSSTADESSEKIDVWLSSKIQQSLLCDDMPINNLINEGNALLSSYIASTELSSVLFILIRKIIHEPIEVEVEKAEAIVEVKEEIKPAIKVHQGLEEKIKAKKASQKQKKETKGISIPKFSTKKKKKVIKKKVVKEVVPVPETELVLEWQTQQHIPATDQFIAIIPKLVNNLELSFDERFHFIHMGANRLFRNSLLTAGEILGDEFSFEMKITILLNFVGVQESRIPDYLKMERFIIMCICSFYCVDSPQTLSDGDPSICLLLTEAIYNYCSTKVDKNCLFLQLSFFDLEIGTFQSDMKSCAFRLLRAVKQLTILFDIYGYKIKEWIKKIFIFTTDVYSTAIAQYITHEADCIFENNSSFDIVIHHFLPYIESCKEFNKKLFDCKEDLETTDKILQAYKLIVKLEQVLQKMLVKTNHILDLESELSVEEHRIEAKRKLFNQIIKFLEENCLQSAVESANLDTLKIILVSLNVYNKELNKIIYN
ncbi:unnamed protein product [Auanema sp. JU1783]|nr:unnamed protein product [Auanema sp. JU1783]